jgi:zinc protease
MLRRFFIPLLLLLVAVAAGVYWVAGRTPHPHDVRAAVPVAHFHLGNGLTVVVMPNDRIPAITHLLFVKAGAADDPYGKTGLAHYLEHLMFAGTQANPEGAYARAIAKVGGVQNAMTTRDYTLFYATVPKAQLPMVMAMESDRLQHAQFDAVATSREMKVITEERAMRVDNSAVAQLVEQLDALTFLNHPYHHPTIGWAEDMAGLTGADAQAFFAQHYRASNMVLVIAGDISLRDARRYAQHYYGVLPGGAAPARDWPQEPPLRLVRHGEMTDAKAHAPQLLRQYIGPSLRAGQSADALPLALLAQYIGGGETGFLYEQLVRNQKLASAVSVTYDPLALGPALFRIRATPAPGVALPQLEQALDAALDAVRTMPPDDASLARAKTLLKADITFAQDGLTPLAHLIGGLYAIGFDEQYFYDLAAHIDATNAAAVNDAAKRTLDPMHRVTGYLIPAAPVAMEVPHAP